MWPSGSASGSSQLLLRAAGTDWDPLLGLPFLDAQSSGRVSGWTALPQPLFTFITPGLMFDPSRSTGLPGAFCHTLLLKLQLCNGIACPEWSIDENAPGIKLNVCTTYGIIFVF